MKGNWKITVVSPVHIGIGESVSAVEYNLKDNMVNHYSFDELLSQIPNKKLIDSRFLASVSNLTSGRSTKDQMNGFIRANVDYRKCRSDYSLDTYLKEFENKNVAIQSKMLNKPYIPGSSVKGCIMNAIAYSLVKNNLQKVCTYENIKEIGKKNGDLSAITDIVYDKKTGDAVKLICNCLVCRDLLFEKMLFVDTFIENINREMPPFEYRETIKPGQTITTELFTINYDKLEIIKKTNSLNNNHWIESFISYFSEEKILECLNDFFCDVIKEEIAREEVMEIYNYYYLDEELKKYSEPKDCVYMRIGMNTNYFFKSISYIIKKRNPNFFMKNFDALFSPAKKAKAQSMPKTVKIYDDGKNYYYPGVVKVEYAK